MLREMGSLLTLLSSQPLLLRAYSSATVTVDMFLFPDLFPLKEDTA